MMVSLKAMRVHRNLTQQQAGDCCGLSKDAISAIERGEREIKAIELDRLCELYQCSREDIILPYKLALSEN